MLLAVPSLHYVPDYAGIKTATSLLYIYIYIAVYVFLKVVYLYFR